MIPFGVGGLVGGDEGAFGFKRGKSQPIAGWDLESLYLIAGFGGKGQIGNPLDDSDLSPGEVLDFVADLELGVGGGHGFVPFGVMR